MRGMWNDIKDHWLASALFVAYWLFVYSLYIFRWNAPRATTDMIPAVLDLHVLLPMFAGAIAYWSGRGRPGRMANAMIVGAIVLAVDVALVIAYDPILNRPWEKPEWKPWMLLEGLPYSIAAGVFGAVFGLIGGWCAAIVHVLDRRGRPAADDARGVTPLDALIDRRLLLIAASLALAVAVIVIVAVIPPVRADTFDRAAPERAAHGLGVTAVLNGIVGLVLLLPVYWRSHGVGRVLVATAGLVSLLLGSAFLAAGGGFAGHGPAMRAAAVACAGCAGGDLTAGALALIAAFRVRAVQHAV